MVAQTQIIFIFVDDNAATNDGTNASKGYHGIRVGNVDFASGVHIQIAQITDMTDIIAGCSMIHLTNDKKYLKRVSFGRNRTPTLSGL